MKKLYLKQKMEIGTLIKENQGTIVDVRSYKEFMGGHVVDSINIALNEIPVRIEEIKSLKAPLILCCASGNRSGQAQHYISQQGIACYNGGSWLELNYLKST
jgi:rhodanese-related sulfurtransferase